MRMKRTWCGVVCLCGSLAVGLSSDSTKKVKTAEPEVKASSEPAILWKDPGDIVSRDLFYGPGGEKHAPRGRLQFDKEDLDGTNAKFVVKDEDGAKWKVKLGIEAKPETVATRIVWAVGFYANEDYFLPEVKIEGMPAHLHRGQNLVGSEGSIHNVRLKREDDKKLSTWKWRDNPFTGTREFNGLRTLMAVINNWDLKDENNAIYNKGGERVFAVSDIGASFGCGGRCWPSDRTKGNPETYSDSKFLRHLSADTVSFGTPARPALLFALNPKEFISRLHMEWIGENIPRADAKWMGGLLARLSSHQIRDAFRAAGYSQQDIDEFSSVLSGRIAKLSEL
ncbi:MAG: hypothetical protein WDO73_23015 [Ignavibacteriota bacterium]